MNRQRLFMVVGLFFAVGLMLALSVGTAAAQVDCTKFPKDPACVKLPPPKATGCSPGFYKHHLTFWVGICCTDTSDPTCGELLTDLFCRGSDASCGRSAAARFLDACTGCSESD